MSNYNDSVGVRKNKTAAIVALAAAIAIPTEGLRQWAYNDIANPALLTVCFGSTTNVQAGKKYSLEECKARLDSDMLKAVRAVETCQPGLPDNVLAAFADAVYNMGPTIACDVKRSTAARLLMQDNYPAACDQLSRWDKARVAGVMVALPGLTKRREKERALCLSH